MEVAKWVKVEEVAEEMVVKAVARRVTVDDSMEGVVLPKAEAWWRR